MIVNEYGLDINYSEVSPNFNDRPDEYDITYLVLHYTACDLQQTLEIFKNVESNVSAHYVVDKNGDVYCMVPEDKRAWHAGISYWNGTESLNSTSIGIEIVNDGNAQSPDVWDPFPEIQMESVVKLCKGVVDKYEIYHENVVGHSDIAPSRKVDPGAAFDWQMLAEHGACAIIPKIDLAPENNKIVCNKESNADEINSLKMKLSDYGYKVDLNTSEFDNNLLSTIKAFKMHFNSSDYKTSEWYLSDEQALNSLLENKKTHI